MILNVDLMVKKYNSNQKWNKDKCLCDSQKIMKQQRCNTNCPWNSSLWGCKSDNYTENHLDNLIINDTTLAILVFPLKQLLFIFIDVIINYNHCA